MRRRCLLPDPPVFHVDRGYDSNYNCQILFEMGMTPNIKQRSISVSRCKPYRSRADKMLDEVCPPTRHYRGYLRRRGVQASPTTLPFHLAGQPPPVRQDPDHHLKHQGAEPTQIWPGYVVYRYHPTARCYAHDRTGMDALSAKLRRGTCQNKIRWNYATLPPSVNILKTTRGILLC